jgi:hypothetical protein
MKYQTEKMIFRLTAEVLEDTVFPILFNMGPVINLTVSDWIGQFILIVLECLLAYVEIKISNSRLITGSCSRSSRLWFLGGNSRRDDELGLNVAGKTHLGVAGQSVSQRSRYEGKK